MSKEMGVILLGLFVLVQPYLGVPNSWHTFFAVVAGIAIMVLGFLLRGEALGRGGEAKEPRRNLFVENTTVFIEQDRSEQ
ncbi:MAG TPA: hypothetical protein VMR46_01565 [Candidatus Paceibacterota bacterium]|nr:hypothetical protein [Candidatus Paceibacterota bacterium]